MINKSDFMQCINADVIEEYSIFNNQYEIARTFNNCNKLSPKFKQLGQDLMLVFSNEMGRLLNQQNDRNSDKILTALD